ncbi:MAG: hypothetical protein ACTHPD_01475 [Rhizomicrobium sp.]
MAGCLVLLAGFCFTGQHLDMSMQDFGLGYMAQVKAPSYEAEITGTDLLTMHDFRDAPKACVEKTCIRYIKICTDILKNEIRCEYRMTWPDLIADGGIVITAQNRDALAIAEREVRKIVYPGDVQIPLSEMTVVMGNDALRECPDGMTAAQCNPA